MKKPKSLQPYRSRMEQRAREASLLPEPERVPFFYCNGRNRADFKAAVESGEPGAVELALEVLAGEVWPQPGYARGFRAALRRAAAADLLSSGQRKLLYAIESRYLERLELAAFYSPLSAEQARACRRLPAQRRWIMDIFGSLPELKFPKLQPVPAPAAVISRMVEAGLLPSSLQQKLLKPDEALIMDLLHDPWAVLPTQHHREQLPEVAADTVCYHLDIIHYSWVIAPWRVCQSQLGFSLAADGSFYCNRDEWDIIFAADISRG